MQVVFLKKVSKEFKIGYRKRQSALKHFIELFSGNIPKRTILVLKDVSFSVDMGEIVGIIGDNGSGKSTILRIIAGIYDFDKGQVKIRGKVISLLNTGAGLKERLTMKDNIYLLSALFGMDKKNTEKKMLEIIEFSELRDFIDTQMYQFSQGMIQRLVFSVAIHATPKILLLDEAFEFGDEEFKMKSAAVIMRLAKKGAAVILVSHDMLMIKKYCNRVFLIKDGQINNYNKSKLLSFL